MVRRGVAVLLLRLLQQHVEIKAISIQDEHNIVVRLPSEIVQEATVGIFVG